LPTLTPPQGRFLNRPERFRSLISGFGGGKTWAGCASICKTSWEHPGAGLGYFGPTYTDIRDIFFPTIEEVAFDWGLDCDIHPGNKEVMLSYAGQERTIIRCRSMDRPSSIVGFKIARAVVDEIDTLPMVKATTAWRKIIARLRQKAPGLQNGADVITTPEGFGFAYQTFEKAPRDDKDLRSLYGLVRCSTYDNEANLPEGYIESLRASYPANLIEAYLYGRFVNLTQGTVYREYNRKLNRSRETIQENEPLFIGMDFNIGKMSAEVHVKRDGVPHAVDELVGALDTPDMIKRITERYWQFIDGDYRKTHQIVIYPDASGKARKTVGASSTDLTLLRDAGFGISAPAANPPVRDRVNSMNAMFCNSKNERRYFVNDDKCPTYAENLEQQAYDASGEPDKKSGKDHTNDAGGYFIHRDYPLRRPVTKLKLGVAM